MNTIINRLESLRKVMIENGISAYIIPGTDPHASEYIADHWKEREWISGFNGSAGTAVVTTEKAGLWTDSRYFLQAGIQLDGSGIELMKMRMPETPDINTWLARVLPTGAKVGVHPQMYSVDAYQTLKDELENSNITIISIDLISMIWANRPALPDQPLFILDVKYSGLSAFQKLMLLRDEMRKLQADVFILSALDEIAWLFNIRGNDVNYNPVVISYAMISHETATLFVDNKKLSHQTTRRLLNENIQIESYDAIYENIAQISSGKSVLIDGARLNRSLFEKIPEGCIIKNELSPVLHLKSIKNETEIAGFKNAMVKDGVALTRFFKWLEENVKSGNVTEITASDKVYEFRSQQPDFMGESFKSISSFAGHGAIVHYTPTPETDVALRTDGVYLLDSGGQYSDGTTDITRTISLGVPSIRLKTDFTLVIKGFIALNMAVFPSGTRGSQLDVLARKALWENKLNYGHGTGHGVGHFLNVHEGPQSIRMEENAVTLKPGMVISNEPSLYRTDQYGLRTENLICVVPAGSSEYGDFLKFDTLTLFPIDKNMIDTELLTEQEINWINDYHNTVYDKLSTNLDENEREWLSNKCAKIK